MRILSWNIWFDHLFFDERMKLVADEILSFNPDVVCLQEAVPKSLSILRELLPQYEWFPNQITQSYQTVIGYHKNTQVDRFYRFRFLNTKMHRHYVMIECMGPDGIPINIASAHVESEFNPKYNPNKISQISKIAQISNSVNRFVWMGDSNIQNHENQRIKELLTNTTNGKLLDCGQISHLPQARINTYDTVANKMNPSIYKDLQSRPDRAFVKNVNVKNFWVLGTKTKPIFGGLKTIHPSDHFGICIEI